MSQHNEIAWQESLKDLITDPNELYRLLDLKKEDQPEMTEVLKQFPLKVPREWLMRIEKGNWHDPLLKQILPSHLESHSVQGYVKDPLQEQAHNPVPGLLHKYYGRVLITLTQTCAVHCRYCFRRHFPYQENNPSKKGLVKIFDYLKANTTITEVILSGGDPLAVSDRMLIELCKNLSSIAHLKRLRIHSRLPVVLPNRITNELLAYLSETSLTPVLVIHANHPNEINEAVKSALLKLKKAHITVLNQSVLLKGVNDDAKTLAALSEVLFDAGVLPYYLHLLDPVSGAAHFDLDLEKAHELYLQLQAALPGYLVPRLVCEQAGAKNKMILAHLEKD